MHKLIIAGFGGQGVLSMGQILVYSAMTDGKEVSWLPSYGPEMRGGTANCSVIVSSEPVASPVISSPDILVILNKPSLYKFIDRVKPGGRVFINSSLVDAKPERRDVEVYCVAASEKARTLGTDKAANIYMMGVVNRVCGLVSAAGIEKGIEYGFHTKPKLIDLNKTIYNGAFESV